MSKHEERIRGRIVRVYTKVDYDETTGAFITVSTCSRIVWLDHAIVTRFKDGIGDLEPGYIRIHSNVNCAAWDFALKDIDELRLVGINLTSNMLDEMFCENYHMNLYMPAIGRNRMMREGCNSLLRKLGPDCSTEIIDNMLRRLDRTDTYMSKYGDPINR